MINVLLAGDQADFGVYAAAPCAAGAVLGDITALASLALAYPDTAQLQEHLPADLLAAYIEHGPCPAIRYPGDFLYIRRVPLPASAVTAAVAAVLALQILEQKHIDAAGRAMRWLISRPGRRKPASTPRPPSQYSAPKTTVLDAVEIKAFTPLLSGVAQLRNRCESHTPTPPSTDTERYGVLIRSLPSELWTEWSLRLVTSGPKSAVMPAVLACAVMLVGTDVSLPEVIGQLGSAVIPVTVASQLDRLSREPGWRDISIALSKLCAYLVRHSSPIDYARRRALDYSGLLPAEEWRRVCHDTRTAQGGAGKAHGARCYLYEMISGRSARRYALGGRPPEGRGFYRLGGFALSLTPPLAAHLESAGQYFLASHSIEEPLSWQPPLSLLDGLDLPGRDPAMVDLAALHSLANRPGTKICDMARALGTGRDVVTHLLTKHPALLDRTDDRRPPRSKIGVAMREVLTAQVLTQLYFHQGLSINAIAKRFGISSWTVRSIAAEQQITLRRFDIHRAPKSLLPVLAGQCGYQRLERFAVVVRYSSISAAARALSLPASSLNAQIVSLERDLGERLLNRPRTGKPMTPTRFGGEIAQTVRDWIGTQLVSKSA